MRLLRRRWREEEPNPNLNPNPNRWREEASPTARRSPTRRGEEDERGGPSEEASGSGDATPYARPSGETEAARGERARDGVGGLEGGRAGGGRHGGGRLGAARQTRQCSLQAHVGSSASSLDEALDDRLAPHGSNGEVGGWGGASADPRAASRPPLARAVTAAASSVDEAPPDMRSSARVLRVLRAAAAIREDAGCCYAGGEPSAAVRQTSGLVYGLLGCPADHEFEA